MQQKVKVAIGLGTYKRPQMLKKCLESLSTLDIPSHVELSLVLADNDADGSAKDTYEECLPKFDYPTYYFLHEEKGIVSVRNRIIDEVLKLDFDYLAFLDDDETAEPEWIAEHMKAMEKYEAHVTAGYVEQILPESTPGYMVEFYVLSSHKTGTIRTSGSTRNIVFDLMLCKDWGLRFHPGLNLTGSSDTFFFEEAYKLGAKMVWVEEARILEEMPESRITKKWLWSRAYRHGNSLVVRTQIREGRLKAFKLLPKALLKLITGSFEWLIFCLFGKSHRIGKVKRIKNALGMINALFGKKYYEYNTTHGH